MNQAKIFNTIFGEVAVLEVPDTYTITKKRDKAWHAWFTVGENVGLESWADTLDYAVVNLIKWAAKEYAEKLLAQQVEKP